ncbi:hypothetical protein AAVH_17617 [Aphelenchoides avenae]|nr:hypothetical protein AAVH_17617 [Aphelenchus avenae]
MFRQRRATLDNSLLDRQAKLDSRIRRISECEAPPPDFNQSPNERKMSANSQIWAEINEVGKMDQATARAKLQKAPSIAEEEKDSRQNDTCEQMWPRRECDKRRE